MYYNPSPINLATSISKMNHDRSTGLERSIINYWGLKPILRALKHALGSAGVHIHIQVVRSA